MSEKIRFLAVSLLFSCFCISVRAGGIPGGPPSGLLTDLVEHTDRVWIGGYPSSIALHELGKTIEPYRIVKIHSRKPSFSWVVNDERNDVKQTSYRIQLGRDRAKLEKGEGDIWDSGSVDSPQSVNVMYDGPELPADTVLYWRVCTYNNGIQAPFSEIKAFHTAETLCDYKTAHYPLQKTEQRPLSTEEREKERFVDFGKAAFAQLKLTIRCERENASCKVRFGEAVKDGHIDRAPGGTIRFAEYSLPLMKGEHSYFVKFRPDGRNTGPTAIKMPPEIGEVYPFRYVEIEPLAIHRPHFTLPLDARRFEILDVSRMMVHYPFDDGAASFVSSDEILNRVWEMCKYSIKATSFAGVYVDGDRERIPYEADALINQLGHYGVDREFSMARRSHEYLIENATWPTEWILQSVLMAHYDYMYTGDSRSAGTFYEDLKAKLLLPLADPETGLISTKTGKQTPELMKAIHYNGKEIRDIVDWPHTGILGLGKNEGGEADGFVFRDYNTVVNAYHIAALNSMSVLAETLGKTEEAIEFRQTAEKAARSFHLHFFNAANGNYRDGIGTDHAALHSSMFPAAFGLVAEKDKDAILKHIRSRGMGCSVYGSQFLMDAIYNAGDADYGLKLLSSQEERSWFNMIRSGSTISMEAWDNKYKPNQDWNHAWGAVPANTIPRKLMGVEPLEAGFARVRIKPQPGGLEFAKARIPTIRGPIKIDYSKTDATGCLLELDIPANMWAIVELPFTAEKSQKTLKLEKNVVEFETIDGGTRLKTPLGSGKHTIRWDR